MRPKFIPERVEVDRWEPERSLKPWALRYGHVADDAGISSLYRWFKGEEHSRGNNGKQRRRPVVFI